MNQSEKFRENAANCALLAKQAKLETARIRYRRMETAWLCLAEEQDWLDGVLTTGTKTKTPPE